ncbi:MAG: hypothetical protein V3V02_11200 [Rhizobiaceae bacterium]
MSEQETEQTKSARPFGRSLSDLWLDGIEGKLHPAEWKLLECAASGEGCTLGKTRPNHPTDENRIRAELLRFIALGGDDENPLHEHGIQLGGAYVECQTALDFNGAIFPENLALVRCVIEGVINLMDALAETLNFNGSTAQGIIGDRAEINGGMFLADGFIANGTIRLLGAKIEGDLTCGNGQFGGDDAALVCDGIEVKGAIFLNDGFQANGTVRLLGAKIGGNLESHGGLFKGIEVALVADGAIIGGSCYLNDGFLALGTVDLSNANINGNLMCQGGTFSSKAQAIHAPRLTVGDNVNLGKGCRVAGQISFQAAEIGGDMTFAHGSFEGKPAVNLRNAEIEGMLVWRDIEHARGELNLSGASCRTLNMDWSSWEKPDQVRIDNFTYRGFSELPKGCDADFWRDWLERQPKRHLEERYRPKPYAQLATVLQSMGHEEEARSIRIEQRKRQSLFTRKFEAVADTFEAKILRKFIVFWNFIQSAVVSYGYRPGKAVFFLAGMIVLGSVIYYAAARDGIMTPTHPLIFKETVNGFIPKACSENWVYPAAGIRAKCEAAVPSEYSTFNAIIYSIDTAIPVVNFRMEADWSPRVVTWDEGKPYSLGWWVRTWEWVQIAFGWGFSLLFVSAIGGVIRRD